MNTIFSFFKRGKWFEIDEISNVKPGSSVRSYFGPEKFTIGPSHSVDEHRDLNNPDYEYFENNFTLIVQNGAGSKSRASIIEIRIDGILIVTTRDFKCKRLAVKHLSNLSPTSVMDVKLKGKAGNRIMLAIMGVLHQDTLTDIEGNYYHTVQLCGQRWMAENLKTTKFNDGTDIPYGTSGVPGSYLWYNNDIGYKKLFGAMYDYKTCATNKLAPVGWHVPSLDEWQTLVDCLTNNGYGYGGSGNEIGKAMAAASGWEVSPTPGQIGNDQGSNNASGFNARPAGDYNHSHPRFLGMGSAAFWCTSTKIAVDPYLVTLQNNRATLDHHYDSQPYHMSVRCVKD